MITSWEEPQTKCSEKNLAFFEEALTGCGDVRLVQARNHFFNFATKIETTVREGLLISENPIILSRFNRLPYTHLIFKIELENNSNCSHYKNNSLIYEIGAYFDGKFFSHIKDYIGDPLAKKNYFNFFLNSFKESLDQRQQTDPINEDIIKFIAKLNIYYKLKKHDLIKL
jgi:hypothetical protein